MTTTKTIKTKNKTSKSDEYWEKRIANETWVTYNSIEEKNIDILKMYERATTNIRSELLVLAEKAEKAGSLERTDQYRRNQLQGQQEKILKECERLGEQIEKHATERMLNGGKRVYGNVMLKISDSDFTYPNKKVMEQMLRSPWHGSFFSERIWKKMINLERNLNGVINNGIATGKTLAEMSIQLTKILQSSFDDTHKLVRSETMNYLNRSAILGYKEAGVKRIKWWCALDERNCKVCGAKHRKPFLIDEAPNLPCHPNCRCTWLPVSNDDFAVSGIDFEE